jgi:hypothetical protein
MEVNTNSVVVSMPDVIPNQQFARAVGKAFFKRFRKKLSDTAAFKLLAQSKPFYEIRFQPTASTAAYSLKSDEISTVEALAGRKSKVIQVRARQRQVTVSRLTPGQTYSVSYRRVYNVKKVKKTFATKYSKSAIFRKK